MYKLFFLFLAFLHFTHLNAQNWLELKESGANYYDIKAAFMKQYKNKLPKFKREAANEIEENKIAKQRGKLRKNDDFEQQMEGIVHFMRWANEVEPRVAEFKGDLKMMHAALEKACIDALNASQSVDALHASKSAHFRSAGSWTLIGPTSTPINGGNGRVNAIRALPTNSNTLFACTPAGGLFKSIDAGASWSPISDGIPVIGATDVAIDPTNINIMYLATGDGEAGDTRSTGIYKSTDGGISWNVTGLSFVASQGNRISRILIDPTTKKLIACGNFGIYTSINGGTNWTQTSSANVKDLDFNPLNTNTIYAGGYAGNVFLRSFDAGATWKSSITPGSGVGSGLPVFGTYRVAVAVTPLDSNYVYCLVADSIGYGFKGLYQSIDGGTTFTLKSDGSAPSVTTPNILGWNQNGADSGGQGWYTLSIVVDPISKGTIYTGGVNIWKNIGSGGTGFWSCVGHWSNPSLYTHADNHDLQFIGTTLYAASDGGISSSPTVTSISWTNKSSNLSNAQLYSLGLSATNANTIISGHQDNGTNLTTNLSTWKEVNGGDGFVCFIDRTTDLNQYSSIYNGALYRSTNSGSSWSNIKNVTNGAWLTPWLQDPNTATTLLAAGTNVTISTNSGTTWTNISSLGLANNNPLITLDVAKGNSNYIATATSTVLYLSKDGGTTWNNKSAGLPTASILRVSFDFTSPTTMYVNTASYIGNSVFRTTDGGTTWTNFATGLPNVPASAIVQQNNGDLYCGTDIGVYYRAKNTASWVSVTTGMPGLKVKDLKIFAPTGKLRAATYARGIWEMDLKNFGLTLSAKIILQGAYNVTTGLMTDALRSLPSFPLTTPYGGTEAINASVLTVTGSNAIVDWVKVELHDKNNVANVLQKRSALLQRDGDIVDTDGSSGLFFSGLPDDSYYVVVSHRNHLGVRSTAAVSSLANNLTMDFSNISTSIYGNIISGTSINQIYSGDCDTNGTIDATDRSATWNNRNLSGYLSADCNLDGVVDANDRSMTWNNKNKTNK